MGTTYANLRNQGLGSNAQAAPTVITACRTISQPGGYVLANNISSGLGDCLVITTNYVTLDLAGYSVSGEVPIHPVAPSPQNPLLGITVRNGSVTGRNSALILDSAEGSIVEGIKASSFERTVMTANGIVRGDTAVPLPRKARRWGSGPPALLSTIM